MYVKCPYCSSPMRLAFDFSDMGDKEKTKDLPTWYECPVCLAESPYGYDEKDAYEKATAIYTRNEDDGK